MAEEDIPTRETQAYDDITPAEFHIGPKSMQALITVISTQHTDI